MSEFVNAPVPFTQVGNRRCLTDQQLFNDRELLAFVRRFPESFEYDANRCVWFFIEPEDLARHTAARERLKNA